jgi:uncharacterized protein (TIGR03083 family)
MSAMEVSEHIAALQRDGELLAAAAQEAGLTSAVPSCPRWQVRDLLRHIGYVHRWAAGYVVERRKERMPDRPGEPELLAGGPPDADLLDWYRAGHAALVSALTEADPGLVCYYFLDAPSPRAFWARRQAHETAIHRVDAELAAGGPPTPAGPGFGADGVDELIMGFFGRDADQLTDAQRAGGRRTLQVVADDAGGAGSPAGAGGAWHLELAQDGRLACAVQRGTVQAGTVQGGTVQGGTVQGGTVQAGTGAADCTLTGPAAGLYLLLWNRADPAAASVAVSGDASVLTAWQEGMRVTWE